MHISFESEITSLLVSLFSRIRERMNLGFCLIEWDNADPVGDVDPPSPVAAVAVVVLLLILLLSLLLLPDVLNDNAFIFANSPTPPLFLDGAVDACFGDVGGVISDCELTTGIKMLGPVGILLICIALGSVLIPEYNGLELGSLSSLFSSLFGSLNKKLYSWVPYLLYPTAVYLDSFYNNK